MTSPTTAHRPARRTYTVPEAGEILGLGRTAVYDAVRRGDIPSLRVGGRVLVPRAALDRLLGEHEEARESA